MHLREIEGLPEGEGLRIGIAVSTFNATITEALLTGALGVLERAGVADCTVVRVPGALELGPTVQRLAGRHDAVIAIGAVIEGETDHYQHVATQASSAITQVTLATGVPVANAILTVRELQHARERALPGPGNKGAEAAEAAIRMVQALRGI